MRNAFDFKDFEQRLLEALNKNEKFIKILKEEESAADQAKKMGLTSMGFGRWGKDDKVTHKTTDGKLEPVTADDKEKEKEKESKPKSDTDKGKGDKNKAGDKKGSEKAEKEGPPKHTDPERQKTQRVLPNARLTGRPLSRVPREDLAPVATRIDDLARMGQEARARGEEAPDYNLCQVSIPGTNLFCGEHKGIKRRDMPQFKGQPEPGSPADKLPKDPRTGEVDTEELFKEMLARDGVAVSEPQEVAPDQLRATQAELKGVQVAGMVQALEENPQHPAITAPIYVSRDGYVLDGHHRWAAIVAYNASNPDSPIPMQVRVIDEDITPLVARANQFAQDIGIKAKAASSEEEPKPTEPETPKEEPKPAEPETAKAAEPPAEKEPEEKAEPKKPIWRRALDAVQGWGKKQKEEAKSFFEQKVHKGKTPERRTMVQKIRDKAVGTVKAVVDGLVHTAKAVPEAARGVRSLLSGKKPNEHERHAMLHIGLTLASTAIFGVAGGHLAHGIGSFAAHVLQGFLPHAVAETAVVGATRAALFAGDEDTTDEKMMEKYLEMILKNIEEMDIPDEILAKAIETYDPNKKMEFNMKDLDSEEAYNKLKEK